MADKRLQVFYTVAKLLSFTKAAESLQMTQPAVTFQIRQLEETFNARLFDRSHNKINLTEAGRRMYEYSERLFDLYREMESAIRDVTGHVAGTLKLGATVAIGDYVLPKLLVAFKKDFPEVNIQLKLSTSTNIASMVENSTIDIGVIDIELDNKMIGTEKITYDEMVIACSPNHPLAKAGVIDIAQLAKEPLILLEEGSGIHTDFSKFLHKQGLNYDQLNTLMELGSIEAIKNAVDSGLGMSVLPKSAMLKDLEMNRLVALQINPPFQNTLSFVYKKQKFQVLNVKELVEFAHKFYKTDDKTPGWSQGSATEEEFKERVPQLPQ